MKNLTKVLTVLLITNFCYQANAQTIGVKGGLTLANQRYVVYQDDDDIEQIHYDMNPGFHLGFTVDVPFNGFLSVEPGIFFTTKGYRYKQSILGVSLTTKANTYYLDIPVALKLSYEIFNGFKLFGTVGPYVGFGLGGDLVVIGKSGMGEESGKTKIKWGNDEADDHFKRFDWGVTFGGGVEIRSILVGVSYDLGLYNISPYQERGRCTNNRILKISVGYRF